MIGDSFVIRKSLVAKSRLPMIQVPDSPKLLSDPVARAARHAQLAEPHVAPLAAFVAALRNEAGPAAAIPDFDPWDGGATAELLYLLEAPGAKAVLSGFISRNNPDETAKNFFELNRAAGIPRRRTVTWNIVPWYIGTGTRIRAAGRSDIEAGLPALTRLLALLPKLKAVVLVGRKAERAASSMAKLRPEVRVFRSPLPSPLFINNARGNRNRILTVLREAAIYLDGGERAGLR
jgi:uracil-DNA glycosylase